MPHTTAFSDNSPDLYENKILKGAFHYGYW